MNHDHSSVPSVMVPAAPRHLSADRDADLPKGPGLLHDASVPRRRLAEVAEVRYGSVKPQSADRGPSGEYRVLVARDIPQRGHLSLRAHGVNDVRFDPTRDVTAEVLQVGDVVLSGSGLSSEYGAIAVTACAEKTLLSDRLVRVRPTGPDLDPEYLAWFLGSEVVRGQLEKKHSGFAVLPNRLSVKALADIEVPVPSRKRQSAIVKATHLLDDLDRRVAQTVQITRDLRVSIGRRLLTAPVPMEAP